MESNQSPEVIYLKTVHHVDLSGDSELTLSPKRQCLSELNIHESSRVECIVNNNNVSLVVTPEHSRGTPGQTPQQCTSLPDVRKRKVPNRARDDPPRSPLSPDPRQTVCASYHQNSDGHRLCEKYRGNQCTAMAFGAILTSSTQPVHTWTSRDMDTILHYGDALHKLLVVDPDRKCSHPRIAIGEIEHGEGRWYTMPMPCRNEDWTKDRVRKVINSVFKSEEYFGSVYANGSLPGDVSMETALTQILEQNYRNVLVTIDDRTGAIILDQQGKLRYFDSHSNNKIGRSHPEGTAVLLTFETVRDFVRHMRRRQSGGLGRFEMFGLNVKCQKRIAVVRPMKRARRNSDS